MSTYRVAIGTNAWAYVTVEADDKDEAIDMAADKVIGEASTLCVGCSGWGRGFNLELNDEWDLKPEVERVEDTTEDAT